MNTITQAQMGDVAHLYLMPFALLINFSLCQYLFVTFYARRLEIRISALLVCSAIGFLAIVPFSHPDATVFEYLDNISEIASTLTFLIQIVVLGRDVNKKVRIQSLKYVTHVAEIFVALEMLLMLASAVKLVDPQLQVEWLNMLTHSIEDVALWFIFFSRFFYITMARGMKKTLATKKVEIFLYLLFATHEYPFIILEAYTDISWQPAQALWNRLTLLFCILHTVKDKIRSAISSRNGTQHKTGAAMSHVAPSYAGKQASVGPSTALGMTGQPRRNSAGKQTWRSKGPSMRSALGVSLKTVVPLSATIHNSEATKDQSIY